MEKKEILDKIKDYKERLYYIDMIDRWTQEDKEDYKQFSNIIKELEKQLKEFEK